MPKYQWHSIYDLNVPELDGDHRVMLELVNLTARAAESGNVERREKGIQRLLEFSLPHFAREETLLTEWGFAEVAVHQDYHRGMYQKSYDNFEKLRSLVEYGETADICNEALAYLVDDIIRGDMTLKSFLMEQGLVVHQEESGE
ncbi:MAG: hypothetical protein EXR08_10905 [Alphaproteobacteria bacterium]|nr:hypothetical protein [Alphaproteobacteria bacterium]